MKNHKDKILPIIIGIILLLVILCKCDGDPKVVTKIKIETETEIDTVFITKYISKLAEAPDTVYKEKIIFVDNKEVPAPGDYNKVFSDSFFVKDIDTTVNYSFTIFSNDSLALTRIENKGLLQMDLTLPTVTVTNTKTITETTNYPNRLTANYLFNGTHGGLLQYGYSFGKFELTGGAGVINKSPLLSIGVGLKF